MKPHNLTRNPCNGIPTYGYNHDTVVIPFEAFYDTQNKPLTLNFKLQTPSHHASSTVPAQWWDPLARDGLLKSLLNPSATEWLRAT